MINPNIKMFKTISRSSAIVKKLLLRSLRFGSFDFVSDFEIRISDLNVLCKERDEIERLTSLIDERLKEGHLYATSIGSH
jgi:hypothetical protein